MFIRSLFVIVWAVCTLNAETVEVRKFQEIKKYTKDLTNKDLVVCDINLVLIRCKHPAFHLRNEEKNKLTLWPFKWRMSQGEKDIFYMAIFAKYGAQILEQDSIALIKNLNTKKAKVLAITTAYTGVVLEKDMTKEHHKWLAAYNFHEGFGKRRIDLQRLESGSKQRPFYEDGILFRTSTELAYSKGDVLKSFLEEVNFNPTGTIVLIDDVKKNLDDIEKAIKELNPDAKIIKLQYTGEYYMDTEPVSSDDMKAAWEEIYEIANSTAQERTKSP